MARFINVLIYGISALAGLETRVAFVDHIGTAAAADHPAETVAFFDRFERIDDFHCLSFAAYGNISSVAAEHTGAVPPCQRRL